MCDAGGAGVWCGTETALWQEAALVLPTQLGFDWPGCLSLSLTD